MRGENSVSSVNGVEEGPGSEFESSLFISIAKKKVTIVAIVFKRDKLQCIHGHIKRFLKFPIKNDAFFFFFENLYTKSNFLNVS